MPVTNNCPFNAYPNGNHLEEITLDELYKALDSVEGKDPNQRLLAVITFKNDVIQTELGAWFGAGRQSIYNWLQRLDTDEPLWGLFQ